MNNTNKCKIILLTGYLGSGKTTLLQYILKVQTLYQVAVIQNEFSDEMGIEAPLMVDNNGDIFDSFFELPNGCICCSAKGQLMTAIQYFIEKKPNIQFIIIESNGLADPSSLIKELWADQGLNLPAELATIVGLIPSHKFKTLYELEIFRKQIIHADLLLLNFQDLCQEFDIILIEKQLKIINPNAKLLKSVRAQIDIQSIFESEKADNKIFDQEHIHFEEVGNIAKIFLNIETPNITQQQWNIKVGQMLWEEGLNIMRIKGLLFCKDEQVMYSLQGVEDIFEITPTNLPNINQQSISKILIIGQQITEEMIKNIILSH
ncbi:unnamed protein product [Paramecium octaurelia]|uniref:CobW C-terminal domain-containing protein n=1 Tax=Paramecium octaurelia TaxID=43137 RepID=A0A8S1XYK3_PAROT|nr:unnamed protein product [Paramecium octaurelia]